MAQQIGWYPGLGGVGGPAGAPATPQAPAQGIDPPVQYMLHLVTGADGKVQPLKLGGAGGQAALPIALQNRAGNPVTMAAQTPAAPVGAIVGRNSDQALTQSVDTPLSFDRVDRDVGGFFCGCDPTELTVPAAGRYAVSFSVEENDTGDTTQMQAIVKKNGMAILSQWAVQNAGKWYASKTSFPQLAAGDVLTLELNSDGTMAVAKGDGSSVPLLEAMYYSA